MNSLCRNILLLVSAAVAVGGCAPVAYVSPVRPKVHTGDARTDRALAERLQAKRRDPLLPLGAFLTQTHTAQKQLAADPRDRAAVGLYNFAVARVVEIIQQERLHAWTQPLRVPTENGDFVLTCENHVDSKRNPASYDFTPTDQLRIGGLYVRERQRRVGIGAPIVVRERSVNPYAHRDFTMPKIHYGATAVLRFEGSRAVLSVEDPLAKDRVQIAGHSFPLAADFTAPIALLLADEKPQRLAVRGLFRPGQADAGSLVLTQPYDPRKTVVLIIHGLNTSAATWTPMVNHLQADEQLRRNYQVWFYAYPSGEPYPHSAAMLRRDLDAIERRYPLQRKMVVVGHSMGGCLARLLITDSGDTLWTGIFSRPPDQTPLPPSSKAQLREELIFHHRPEIGRVIFIATPLRGSQLARSYVGRVASTLVHLPSSMVNTGTDAVRAVAFQQNELRLARAPNSIDLLTPDNRFVQALARVPVSKGIPHYVICGDRGMGGHKDKTPPVMTDGIVPYWSSHMVTAESELIVPAGHSTHQNAEAIEEVGRILKAHARR